MWVQRWFAASASSLCLMIGLASAAEIGRVDLNGRTLIIDDTGTWKYAEQSAAVDSACSDGQLMKSRKLDLSVCVREPWIIDDKSGAEFEIKFTDHDDEIFAGLITERSNLPLKMLEYAILTNAADATGVRKKDIPVIKKSKIKINGVEWSYIEYNVDFKGAKFTFGNYYISLGETGAVQAVFWCSKAYFDKNRKIIEDAAMTLKVSDKVLQ
jgi:hypothetical protein